MSSSYDDAKESVSKRISPMAIDKKVTPAARMGHNLTDPGSVDYRLAQVLYSSAQVLTRLASGPGIIMVGTVFIQAPLP
jgi:hypothetical protein